MLTTITLLWGHLGERTNNVPNSLRDFPDRMGLCVSRIVRRNADVGLDVGSRTTNFLRSTAELITMGSPVETVSDVLHGVPQHGGELRVLFKHGADRAEEFGEIARNSKDSRDGLRGRRIEVCKGRVWGVVGGRSVRRWNFLDIDGSIGGGEETIARNLVDVNRRFLWGVAGEDGICGRCGVGIATLAFVP